MSLLELKIYPALEYRNNIKKARAPNGEQAILSCDN
jgi:hypothetical protein